MPPEVESGALAPARLSLVAVALVAAASLLPASIAAPRVPDVIVGEGHVTTFQVLGMGQALEGGAYDWNEVCGGCQIRFATTSTTFFVVDTSDDDALGQALTPGLYELRDFHGLFAFHDDGRHSYQVDIYGKAKIVEVT